MREDGSSLYLIVDQTREPLDPWVALNVWPLRLQAPAVVMDAIEAWPSLIAEFLAGDDDPCIISDWPDDIRYFCGAVITGPGTMADIPQLQFAVKRVDAYPTTLRGAVQHNAWWDAMALRHLLAA